MANNVKIFVQELAFTGVPFNDDVKASIVEVKERIYSLIQKAQMEGTVRKSDPQILMVTLLNLFKGFIYSLLNNKDISEYPLLRTEIINFLVNGIKA